MTEKLREQLDCDPEEWDTFYFGTNFMENIQKEVIYSTKI